MKDELSELKLCFEALSSLMIVNCQKYPYFELNGIALANNSIVKLSDIGTSKEDGLQCITDLQTCCSGQQGYHRGDWYFPDGKRLQFNGATMWESRDAQTVFLVRENSNIKPPSGLYYCRIATNAVHDHSNLKAERIYINITSENNKPETSIIQDPTQTREGCNTDEGWDNDICQSPAIKRVVEEAKQHLPGAHETIKEVTPELLANVTYISEELAEATAPTNETGLSAIDLQATNGVMAQALNVLESSTKTNVSGKPNEVLVDVFNNILNETNQQGWSLLQSTPSSQTLLQNTERYGNYLAATINDTNRSLMLSRENIVLEAQVLDPQSKSDIVFSAQPRQMSDFNSPERQSAQITIPTDALAHYHLHEVSVVNIIVRNIATYLPLNTTNFNDSWTESLVLSSQLNIAGAMRIPPDLFTDNPITLNFSLESGIDVAGEYKGVFWKFSDPVGRGGWSSDGVEVISVKTRNNVTTVVCNSTHLTSFTILVDVTGGVLDAPGEEQLALHVVSYIGCIISTICLSISVVFYLSMGKRLFSAVHYFVHLNLSISLLLGYIAFMFGIELGKSTEEGCVFVAALLQYLFLSAFCWMLCEGIMLYLMLVVVFSRLSKKWWFFFILGYCTPVIFLVIGLAVRSEHYAIRDDDGKQVFCWLSTEKNTILVFVVPMIIIITINAVFLMLTLLALYNNKIQKLKESNKTAFKEAISLLKATFILLPLLGVTWLFGLLTLNNNTTVFAWLFTIFNSFQGSAIFFFHVVRNKTVRNSIYPRVFQVKKSMLKASQHQTSKSTASHEIHTPPNEEAIERVSTPSTEESSPHRAIPSLSSHETHETPETLGSVSNKKRWVLVMINGNGIKANKGDKLSSPDPGPLISDEHTSLVSDMDHEETDYKKSLYIKFPENNNN